MCATAACSPFVLYEGRKVRAVYFLCGTAALSAVACFLYPTSNVQWEGAREQGLPSILALCACNERRVNATAIALFHANCRARALTQYRAFFCSLSLLGIRALSRNEQRCRREHKVKVTKHLVSRESFWGAVAVSCVSRSIRSLPSPSSSKGMIKLSLASGTRWPRNDRIHALDTTDMHYLLLAYFKNRKM